MAKQVINNTDSSPDPVKTAFTKCNDNFTELYGRKIYPEDYSAVGDGSTDDNTPVANYISRLNDGSNKSIGSSLFTTYMVSTVKQITRNVMIDFWGTLKRTAASTADTILQLSFGTAGKTSVKISVDGNSANANVVTGILIDSGSNNTKSSHDLTAEECDIGIKVTGNVEKLVAKCNVRSNIVGVNINNDGSANTPDEIKFEINGADCDTFLLSDGTEKISYVASLDVEQSDDNTKYAVDHQNGVGTISGGLRGAHGGISISTNSALQFKFDNFRLYGKGAGSDLRPILCDAPNCLVSGQTDLYEWEEGIWIVRCAAGSFLQAGKRDTGSVGTGLRIGDFTNTKLCSFNYQGTLFGTTYALHLDYSRNSRIDVLNVIDSAGILISANSDSNTILIPKASRAIAITNNRTENDNLIYFKGNYTNAELEEITSPFKGMMVENLSATDACGPAVYTGTAWRSFDGKTYNAGTNTWA